MPKVLLIEDSTNDAELIIGMLDSCGDNSITRRVDRLSAGLRLLQIDSFDVILLDLRLSDSFGLDALIAVRNQKSELPIIVLTGLSDDNLAKEAISMGAQDYLVKGKFDADLLSRVMRYAIEQRRLQAEQRKIADAVPALIAYVDSACRYRFVNRAYELWFGLKQEEIIGKHVREVLGESAWQWLRPYTERALSGEQVVYENELSYKYGQSRWVHVSYTPDSDDRGQIRGFTILAQDVSWSKRVEIERKRTQEALIESEERYRRLFDVESDAIFVVNLKDNLIIDANKAATTLFGYSKEEFLAMHIADISAEPDKTETAIKEQQPRVTLRLCRKKNGTVFPVEISGSYFESVGRQLHVGVIHDITERKQAEAMLQKNRSDLMVILDNLPFLAWLKDTEGRFIAVNIPFAHACGHSWPADLIGKTDLDIWPKHLAERYRADDNAVILSGKKKAVEEVINDRGVDNWFETYKAPLFDVDGKCTGTTGFARDISERKRAEESLKKRKENFRLLIDRNPVSMAVADKGGNFSFFNKKFIEIFGYTLEDISSVDEWWPRAYPDDEYRQKVINGWRTAANKAIENRDRMGTQEWRVTCKDGSLRDIEFRMASLQDFNIVIFHDVTERKVLEQQLIQAQKMESVARLAGGVAHDFNNMLGVILGHVELTMMQVNSQDPMTANLEEIRKAAERSADLTRQLLAFARRQTVAPKVLDLNHCVKSMLKMLQRLIGEDIDLAWIPGTNLWPIKIDPAQIDQLLANLCVNARDAISEVGKVTIETENITFDEAYCAVNRGFVCGAYVMLAVSDDGSGMSKDVIDHLFEPFFTTKEAGKGTGLGLATVYGIVKQNEGFIIVDSKLGEGTTVKVYLPRFAGEVMEPAPESALETPRGSGELILLVEDEMAILNVCREMLEELGYKVMTASTPKGALSQFKAHVDEIQLLITDVVMPEMNGRDLAKLISEIKSGVKCLFTSGYTADVIAHHGVLDQGLHFLQKPISINDLAYKVREVLQQK